jgi:glutamate-ammonia-ligase adenylyltransferase
MRSPYERPAAARKALHVMRSDAGMREFDLASDADLVFVLADSAGADMVRWTRSQRIIDLLTAYTGDGMLFAVDTRCGPTAEAVRWYDRRDQGYFDPRGSREGITYMSRAWWPAMPRRRVSEAAEIDWRRYGQGGRSRLDLSQMRMKLRRSRARLIR